MKRYSIAFITIFIIVFWACQNSKNIKSGNENPLINYLEEYGETPENYVIKKFDNHDYIIIGEFHRIKHDVELIVRLIPELYEKGVYHLAIESGAYSYQHLVDSLLNLPHFDRKLARTIVFKSQADWAFKEYIDIYETAWKVNQTIGSDEPKFRVINLSPPFDPCKKGIERFGGHDYDRYMADVVLNELVRSDKKALIFAGAHHSFTSYHHPVYDFEENKLYKLEKTRMGNILYDSLNDRVFNIYLHFPWTSDKEWGKNFVPPVNGVIDSIMGLFDNKRVGFDTYNSPFGELPATDTYYAFGHPNFSLKMFCDGYIFQNQYEDYESVTMEEDFINSENLVDFIAFMKCAGTTGEELDSLNSEKINRLLFYDVREKVKHLIK